MQKDIYSGKITWLDGDSHELLGENTIIKDKSVDLLVVDGDHTYEGAKLDLINCWPLLKKGGVLVFDDIRHEQHLYLLDLAQEFCNIIKHQFHSIDLDEGHGVCAWKKSS